MQQFLKKVRKFMFSKPNSMFFDFDTGVGIHTEVDMYYITRRSTGIEAVAYCCRNITFNNNDRGTEMRKDCCAHPVLVNLLTFSLYSLCGKQSTTSTQPRRQPEGYWWGKAERSPRWKNIDDRKSNNSPLREHYFVQQAKAVFEACFNEPYTGVEL